MILRFFHVKTRLCLLLLWQRKKRLENPIDLFKASAITPVIFAYISLVFMGPYITARDKSLRLCICTKRNRDPVISEN